MEKTLKLSRTRTHTFKSHGPILDHLSQHRSSNFHPAATIRQQFNEFEAFVNFVRHLQPLDSDPGIDPQSLPQTQGGGRYVFSVLWATFEDSKDFIVPALAMIYGRSRAQKRTWLDQTGRLWELIFSEVAKLLRCLKCFVNSVNIVWYSVLCSTVLDLNCAIRTDPGGHQVYRCYILHGLL